MGSRDGTVQAAAYVTELGTKSQNTALGVVTKQDRLLHTLRQPNGLYHLFVYQPGF